MIARAFYHADRVARFATTAATRVATRAYRVHEAIWLGLLDREDLSIAVALHYDKSDRYLGDEHNLSGLFPWETAVLEREFRECASILVAAAGGGREALALAARGIRVGAFDPAPALVEAARRLLTANGVVADYLLAEPGRVPAALGVYDGAIVGWGGYSHIPDSARRVEFLRELAAHLKPGSPLLLSFWERSGQERQLKVVAAIARFLGRLGFAGSRVELGDSTTHGFAHYFERDELERELVAAGFSMSLYSVFPLGHAVAVRGA